MKGRLAERVHVLRDRLWAAKLAGRVVKEDKDYGYHFRSNEQAADLAAQVVDDWLQEHTIRRPEVDLDAILLVERIATALRDAETEWRRHEVVDRDDYADKFIYQAEAVIEELEGHS